MKAISRKMLYILSTIFIICGMLLIMPGPLYAGTEDGPVTLKTQHIGLPWNDPTFANESPPSGVTVNAGQYMWHLVLSPTLNIATTDATLTLFSGDTLVKTEQNGATIHFYIVNTNPNAQAWVANVIDGLQYNPGNGTLQTELRVSHTWYGGNSVQAGIAINKSILGGSPATGTFSFNVYNVATGGTALNGATPLTITITNGTSGSTPFTSASLTAGTTYYVEELATSGFTANTTNRVSVVAVASTGTYNAATFENTPNTPPPPPPAGSGSVTITKNIDVAQPAGTDVAFTFTLSGPTYGSSTHTIIIPGGSTSASTTISPLPFDPYTVSEDGIPTGWTLIDSSNTSFVLSASSLSANPSFTNSIGAGITVAGIATGIETAGASEEQGTIEVAGITNLPFTGQNSYLAIIGSIMLALGISMAAVLVLKKRKPNLFLNLYSRFSFLKKN